MIVVMNLRYAIIKSFSPPQAKWYSWIPNSISLLPCLIVKTGRWIGIFKRALKADQYPTVELELTNLHISSSNLSQLEDQWAEATAKVNITLAGVTKTQFVRVKVKRAGSSALQIDGSKSLKMTDFEITPPEVLFGMIKVNDQITLHFNLNVQIV